MPDVRAAWFFLRNAGSFAYRRMGGAVLSHSRERTKGRPGDSQSEPAPWLPPDPSSLGLGAQPPAARGYRLPRGGGLERLWVLCLLSAGDQAHGGCLRRAQVCGPDSRLWGQGVFACCAQLGQGDTLGVSMPDRSCAVRLSAAVHGRRSRSTLRRPPQEVAASLHHDGARKHGRSGATVGEPRPSSRNQAPFPSGEGVTAKAVTDRENPACSASRLARCEACPPQARLALREPGLATLYQSPRMRVQRAEGSLARVWGEEPQRPPHSHAHSV